MVTIQERVTSQLMLEPQKQKKLQEYIGILSTQGQHAEREGRNEDAVKAYIKLVDVLLLLAREAPDHPSWMQYSKQAENYQSKARALIPPEQRSMMKAISLPEPPALGKSAQEKAAPEDAAAVEAPKGQSSSSSLKRIFRPFQKSEITTAAAENQAISSEQPETSTVVSAPPSYPSSSGTLSAAPAMENMVSSEVLQQVIEEGRRTQEQLAGKIHEKEEKIANLQLEIKELKERIKEMVPRHEHQALQAQLLDSISRQEFERLRSDLLNSVPRTQYEDLLNRFSSTVPRDLYIAAELKAARIEAELKSTLPKNVLDSLSSEINLLSALADVPISEEEEGAEKRAAKEKSEGTGEAKKAVNPNSR